MICKNCQCEFTPRTCKQIFCHKLCGDKFRQRTVYKGAAQKRYRAATPERFIKSLLSYHGRRKTLSPEYVFQLYNEQQGLCAISGVLMTYTLQEGYVATNISIDRIDSSKGYEEGNIQLVCRIVNTMKLQLTLTELRWWCQQILSKD